MMNTSNFHPLEVTVCKYFFFFFRLNHPNILQLIDTFETRKEYFIFQDLWVFMSCNHVRKSVHKWVCVCQEECWLSAHSYCRHPPPPPPQQPQRERVHFDEIFFLSNTQHYSGQLKCCFALMESLQRVPDQYSRAGHFHDTCVLCNSSICSFIGGQQEFTAHGVTAHICLYISVCLSFFVLFCF